VAVPTPKPARIREVAAMNDVKSIVVEQYSSSIRRPAPQKKILAGLGVKRVGDRCTHKDTPEVRGAVAKIAHLVRIVDGA
jgi:large subunit ribosomal protein L30